MIREGQPCAIFERIIGELLNLKIGIFQMKLKFGTGDLAVCLKQNIFVMMTMQKLGRKF